MLLKGLRAYFFNIMSPAKPPKLGAGRPVSLGPGHSDGAQAGTPQHRRLWHTGALSAPQPAPCSGTPRAHHLSGYLLGETFSLVREYIFIYFPGDRGRRGEPQAPAAWGTEGAHWAGKEGRERTRVTWRVLPLAYHLGKRGASDNTEQAP